MRASSDALLRFERHLGRVLVAGVALSTALLAGGLLCWLWGPAGVVSQRLLSAGLIVLMATPILRVGVSFVEYLRMKDWFFAATTVIVLVELAVTMLIAFKR
jgi:uncharacterized membrane protein